MLVCCGLFSDCYRAKCRLTNRHWKVQFFFFFFSFDSKKNMRPRNNGLYLYLYFLIFIYRTIKLFTITITIRIYNYHKAIYKDEAFTIRIYIGMPTPWSAYSLICHYKFETTRYKYLKFQSYYLLQFRTAVAHGVTSAPVFIISPAVILDCWQTATVCSYTTRHPHLLCQIQTPLTSIPFSKYHCAGHPMTTTGFLLGIDTPSPSGNIFPKKPLPV